MNTKAKYGSIQVFERAGKLHIRFRLNSHQYRMALGLVDTVQNRGLAQTIANQIEQDIVLNQFDETLEKYKPQSKIEKPKKNDTLTVLECWDIWTSTLTIRPTNKHYGYTRKWILKNKLDKLSDLNERIKAINDVNSQTKQKRVTHLKSALEYCAGEGLIKPIVINWKPERCSRQVAEDRQPFTKEEAELILNAIETNQFCNSKSAFKHSHYLPYIECLALTGCRPNEVTALQWKHVNLTDNTLTISQAFNIVGELASTKTGSVRVIPMNERLRAVIEGQKIPGKSKPNDFIFLSHKGNYIDHRNVRKRIWKPVLKGLGILYRVPYALRHSMASRAIEQGIPLTGIAYLMGHSSTEMVVRRYGHMINRPQLPDL